MVQPADRKVYATGQEAQEKLSAGINKGADVVAGTLGVGGKNILIERKFKTPHAVDDGYTAINNLILDDELENLGVTSLVDAANKASEHAGDGTSTTIVLTRAIYEEGRKLASNGFSIGKTPMEIKENIFKSRDRVIELLKESSIPCTTKEDLKKVALAAYADEKMAETVSELVHTVGENGIVLVEEGWGRETEVELLTGMRFAGKLAHGFFANTAEEGLDAEELPVLVTDFDFVKMDDALAILGKVVERGHKGVIIVGNRFDDLAIKQVVGGNTINARNGNPFKTYLVRTPSFTPSQFEDFAIYLGAKYVSKERKDKLSDCNFEDLGSARSFKITKYGDGIILGGGGTKEKVDERIKEVRKKWEDEKVKQVKNVLQQRIASLASAIGIIKVASPTEGETENIRLKVKNAVKSAQSAAAEGMIEGGGLALYKIADKLEDGAILKEAIKSPYEIIKRNAGGKVNMEGIFDALKVIRTALEEACSQAWLLINTGTIIAFKSEVSIADAVKLLSEKINGTKSRKDE
jgi:chaperonin GroEL